MRVRNSRQIATLDGNLRFVAGLERFALQRGEREDAFGLVADVEEDCLCGHGDHRAFQLFAALGLARVALLELRENVAEGFRGLGDRLCLWILWIGDFGIRH